MAEVQPAEQDLQVLFACNKIKVIPMFNLLALSPLPLLWLLIPAQVPQLGFEGLGCWELRQVFSAKKKEAFILGLLPFQRCFSEKNNVFSLCCAAGDFCDLSFSFVMFPNFHSPHPSN